MSGLTADELREFLVYNSETGEFFWRESSCLRHRVWFGKRAGSPHNRGYRQTSFRGKRYTEHRLAWLYMTGKWPSHQIDHINGQRSDNRFSNLREATQAENSANMKRKKKSGLKGAYKQPCAGEGEIWMSQIVVNGKMIYLGRFRTEELAHAAYAEAAKKYFGEFARPARTSVT